MLTLLLLQQQEHHHLLQTPLEQQTANGVGAVAYVGTPYSHDITMLNVSIVVVC